MAKIISDWTQFTEEVQLPSDVAVALSVARPEMLVLARRAMTKEEVTQLLEGMRVLMETNQALQLRCSTLYRKLQDNVLGNLKGIDVAVHRMMDELAGRIEDDEG